MSDLSLAKEYLVENDLNFVLVLENEILSESRARGIRPIYDAYKKQSQSLKGASVGDRVIGKAAAMFLIEGGIKSLYTDLISDPAYDLLIDRGIEVEYLKKVPVILNRTGDDICPMEKLSSKADNLDQLIESIEEFFRNTK